MVVGCPNCEARFKVSDDALGATGRRVKCGDCGHVWRAHPEDGEPRGAAGEAVHAQSEATAEAASPEPNPAATSQAEAEATAGEAAAGADAGAAPGDRSSDSKAELADVLASEAEETLRSEVGETMRRLREEQASEAASSEAARLPKRRWVALGWAAWVIFVAAIVAGGLGFRQSIEQAWPPAQTLYAGLGLTQTGEAPAEEASAASAPEPDSPAPEAALRVRFDSQPDWQALQDGWRLTISGSIANQAQTPARLPTLTVILMDSEESELKRVPVTFERESLAGGERFEFDRVVDDAPAETAGITYEWSGTP